MGGRAVAEIARGRDVHYVELPVDQHWVGWEEFDSLVGRVDELVYRVEGLQDLVKRLAAAMGAQEGTPLMKDPTSK